MCIYGPLVVTAGRFHELYDLCSKESPINEMLRKPNLIGENVKERISYGKATVLNKRSVHRKNTKRMYFIEDYS